MSFNINENALNNPEMEKDGYGRTEIHLCAINCDIDRLRKILDCNKDVNDVDDFDWTALHYASLNDSFELCQLLVSHHADSQKTCPMIRADFKEQFSPAQLQKINVRLVFRGNNFSEADDCWMPVHLAALCGNRSVVEFFLKDKMSLPSAGNGMSVEEMLELHESSQSVEDTPICTAVQNRQVDVVQKLINDGADVNEKRFDRYAPLHWAVIADDEEIVRALVNAGAGINARTPAEQQNPYPSTSPDYFNGFTPLHIAVAKKHLDVAKFLIESGANFSIRNETGQVIMDIADEDDKREIESFVQKRVPVTENSFRWILETMSLETAKILISNRGASMKTLNNFLCIASYHGNMGAIDYLLERKTNVNSEYDGNSPLGWAIYGERAQAVQKLIYLGADIHNKGSKKYSLKKIFKALKYWFDCKGSGESEMDASSDSLLHQAATFCGVEIVEMLVNAGAETDAKNDCDCNPLYCAAIFGHDEAVVKFLHGKGETVKLWKKADDSDTMYKTAKYIVYSAAEKGKPYTLRIFIEAGVEVDFEYNRKMGYSAPLLAAIYHEREDIVRLMLDKGANPNRESDETTPLILAVGKMQLEITAMLLHAGADINKQGGDGCTPIVEAVKYRNKEMIQLLIEKGKCYYNGLHVVAAEYSCDMPEEKCLEIARLLIDNSADVNATDDNGQTPLHLVKNARLAELFIENGAKVNAIDSEGRTPLHMASDAGIAQLLISNGATIDALDHKEKTPLLHHVGKSKVKIVQLLLEKGANFNAKDDNGDAPIHFARDRETAEVILNTGANINDINISGETPLFQRTDESHVVMVQFLVEKGADVNSEDEKSITPLHFAKNKEIAEILIAHGANINAETVYEMTPLDYYVENSLVDMVQLLLNKGVNVNARSSKGYAPIHYVKNREVAEILISAGADVNVETINGRNLVSILTEEQSKSYTTESRKEEISKLLKYLRS